MRRLAAALLLFALTGCALMDDGWPRHPQATFAPDAPLVFDAMNTSCQGFCTTSTLPNGATWNTLLRFRCTAGAVQAWKASLGAVVGYDTSIVLEPCGAESVCAETSLRARYDTTWVASLPAVLTDILGAPAGAVGTDSKYHADVGLAFPNAVHAASLPESLWLALACYPRGGVNFVLEGAGYVRLPMSQNAADGYTQKLPCFWTGFE